MTATAQYADVTAVIFITEWTDSKLIRELNERMGFPEGEGLSTPDDVRLGTQWYGGDRAMTKYVTLGAFRNLDIGALVMSIRKVGFPSEIQLLVRQPGKSRFVAILPWETPPGWVDYVPSF